MKLIDIEKLPYKLVSIEHENGWENEVVVFAKDIDKQPSVEAIPISWIDSYITDSEIGITANNPINIKMMVEDWLEEGK